MEKQYEYSVLGKPRNRTMNNLITRYSIKFAFIVAFIFIIYLVVVASESTWNPWNWGAVGITIFTFTSLLMLTAVVQDRG